jgi:prepilin-type N-terminal cleavage/methylation domain-containing protein
MRTRQNGFTLIELTVVLAVIVTLALMLTPSITSFISDSRLARARADTQTISAAIIQFYRDNAFFPMWTTASGGGPGGAAGHIDLLVSAGNVPVVTPPTPWTTGAADQLTNQLIANTPSYAPRTATATFGWNGPYVASPIGADPWNNRYVVDIGLIDPAVGTQAGGATKSAVWAISGGPNGIVDTPYTQPITMAVVAGDDIAVRLQ